jgi:hypothetical protein
MATEKWVADAHQLLIEIERIYEDHYSRSYNQCVHDIFNAMRRIVRRNATFRTVEVVHGRWIEEYVYDPAHMTDFATNAQCVAEQKSTENHIVTAVQRWMVM